MAHLQPEESSTSHVQLVIDITNTSHLVQYSGANFSANATYGYTMSERPDNEFLLSNLGYTFDSNPFDFVEYSLKNSLPSFGANIRELLKSIKCWEEGITAEDVIKEKELFFRIKPDVVPNTRLLNFIR